MTVVLVDLRRPDATGVDVPAVGALRWQPTLRRTVGTHITLPDAFTVELVDGRASVDVAPTGLDWCWTVREFPRTGIVRHVQVPALGPVNYSALVDVDPKTLEPAAEPEAAWWAAWTALAAGTYLVPDPAHPGLYLAASGSSMTPDPDHTGLYTIGTPA